MTYLRKTNSVLCAREVKSALKARSTKDRAETLKRFFKTGKGEYGEGDVFLGVTVPEQREISRKYATLALPEIACLLQSEVHEHRFTALLVLAHRYKKADTTSQGIIAKFYLKHLPRVNNWDLVDTSAPYILGEYCRVYKKENILFSLAVDRSLWKRRVAIVATWSFIKNGELELTIKVATLLLSDKEDLLHKAVGWMLRELGKRDKKVLLSFLHHHGSVMPRTMLRYAIEKFPDNERTYWLQNTLRKKNP